MEQKWKWDPDKKEVTILKNGEYMLGISDDQYVTIKVEVKQRKSRKKEVEAKDGNKEISEAIPGETI